MEAKAAGIKCDNPSCDYADWSVKQEDYKDWVDRPCPKCQQNLLTRSDYNFIRRLSIMVKVLDHLTRWFPTRKSPQSFEIKRKNWK